MNKEDNNKEMMQTFSMLMGEMMMSDKPIKKEEKHIINNANTAVIVTPFDFEDDIELEMINEFWICVIKHYLNGVEDIEFVIKVEQANLIEELKKQLAIYEESIEDEYHLIRSTIDENVRAILSDPLDKSGSIKWEGIKLYVSNEVKVIIESKGNQCVIFKLDEEDHKIIEEITSEYFSISYF